MELISMEGRIDRIVSKGTCTGCYACYNVCKANAIAMRTDKHGFIVPSISESSCLHCGLCLSVCPSREVPKRQIDRKSKLCFCAMSLDRNVYYRSSSGGAFSGICEVLADNNTVIFAAKMEGFRVRHISIDNIKEIGQVTGSKYIQSEVGKTFIEAEKNLRNGKKVIWCGTPCQIAGLRMYLRREYANLYCIDFICHGVGNTQVLKQCVSIDAEGNEVKKYRFRSKLRHANVREPYTSEYWTNHGRFFIERDRYTQIFLKQLCLRNICIVCPYRSCERFSDITIADFKSFSEIYPTRYYDRRFYSSIVCNTEKGKDVAQKLFLVMKVNRCDYNLIARYNPLIEQDRALVDKKQIANFWRSWDEDSQAAITGVTVRHPHLSEVRMRLLTYKTNIIRTIYWLLAYLARIFK